MASELVSQKQRRVLLTLVWIFSLVACQTSKPIAPQSVPPLFLPYFTACVPGDGSLSLKLFDGEGSKGSADAQWVAKKVGDWQIKVTDPLGQELIGITRQARRVNIAGRLRPHLDSMRVDASGFVEVGGDSIGLRASEVPCVLAGRLPVMWKDYIYALEARERKLEADLSDGVRSIHVTIEHPGDPVKAKVCSHIGFARMLFFHAAELQWCVFGPKLQQTKLEGLGEASLEWTKTD